MDWNTLATLLVALGTLLLIMTRPRGLSEAIAALIGALLMLLLGRVSLGAVVGLLGSQWDVFIFFLGLMTIAAIADEAGFFDWTAAIALKLAGGSGRRLFLNVCLLGALISTFLSNDATALILTPVVYTLVTRLKIEPLPFMFACTFMADTASFVLPVSNPINILIGNAFPQTQGLGAFWQHMLLASVIAISLNIGLFLLLFRRQLPGRFALEGLERPGEVVEARGAGFFKYVAACLSLVAVGYVAASLFGVPVSFVALGGAIALVGGAWGFGRLELAKLRGEISWSIFLFIGAMFVVVQGVESIGLTGQVGQWIVGLVGTSSLMAVLVGTFGTAIGTNFINNVPMALFMISVLQQIQAAHLPASVNSGLIYSTMLGADLGPNLTTVGSLATVLWLLILRRKGLEISPLQYFKTGLIVTPLMLGAAALSIWLSVLF